MGNNAVKTDALSRRRFLMGATSLALGAVAAGCGGGGGDDGDLADYLDRTYFGIDTGREVTAGITVDDEGLLTYWTLDYSDGFFFDADQTFLRRDRRFEVIADNVQTFGEFRRGDRVRGRTESSGIRRFDWEASRVGEPPAAPPPRRFVGSFAGSANIQGVNAFVFLGVSSDGNATFFGYFDFPAPVFPVPVFESLSIDRFGDGYDYLLNFYDDRIALRDLDGGVSLLYTFDPDDAQLGQFAGDTFEVRLERTRAQAARSLRLPHALAADTPGARRVMRALRARETKRP